MLHRPLYRFLGRFLAKNDRRKIAAKILMEQDHNYGIRNAQLVNSRSILFSCDIHPDNPQSSIANTSYLDSITAKLSDYSRANPFSRPSIFIPSDGLIYFAQRILPQIDSGFILVSGDSDLPINTSSLGIALDSLLSNPLVLAWHAQNRDVDHPRLHSLPIGINLHNLWSNPLQWGGGFILPTLQELQLQTIAENAPNFFNRDQKIFCNWHFSIDRADRKDCLNRIDKSICFFQPEPRPMVETWEMQSKFQFVLSPHGAGLDCHRTWEALLLGCVPIVKAAKINDLFENLPVIVINDWQEINQKFLENAKQEVMKKSFSLEKLSMRYWKSQIKSLPIK
jgi:hypothetical protein